jgi:putative transferase (TIGR04331 family)
MNIPIFMVWEKEWFPFNERAKRYLEDFEKKNIFFEKPQELVEKISEIIHLYGDIGTWWNQEDIQNLRKSWMDKYGLARKNWRKYWIKQFLELK